MTEADTFLSVLVLNMIHFPNSVRQAPSWFCGGSNRGTQQVNGSPMITRLENFTPDGLHFKAPNSLPLLLPLLSAQKPGEVTHCGIGRNQNPTWSDPHVLKAARFSGGTQDRMSRHWSPQGDGKVQQSALTSM